MKKHRRINDAWADEVDPDPLGRQLRGCACRQADQTVFRRDIGRAGSETQKRVNGPNVDNRPVMSARKHGSSLILQTQKSALQIDIEDSVPFLLGQLHDACELPFDARVIHGVVEASKGLNRVVHHPFHVLRNRDIRGHEAGLPSLILYLIRERSQLVFAPRGEHYPGPLRCECLSRRPAQFHCSLR